MRAMVEGGKAHLRYYAVHSALFVSRTPYPCPLLFYLCLFLYPMWKENVVIEMWLRLRLDG